MYVGVVPAGFVEQKIALVWPNVSFNGGYIIRGNAVTTPIVTPTVVQESMLWWQIMVLVSQTILKCYHKWFSILHTHSLETH